MLISNISTDKNLVDLYLHIFSALEVQLITSYWFAERWIPSNGAHSWSKEFAPLEKSLSFQGWRPV